MLYTIASVVLYGVFIFGGMLAYTFLSEILLPPCTGKMCGFEVITFVFIAFSFPLVIICSYFLLAKFHMMNKVRKVVGSIDKISMFVVFVLSSTLYFRVLDLFM